MPSSAGARCPRWWPSFWARAAPGRRPGLRSGRGAFGPDKVTDLVPGAFRPGRGCGLSGRRSQPGRIQRRRVLRGAGRAHRRAQPARDVLLAGATAMGRSMIPRVATAAATGLTADCTGLAIDPENGQPVADPARLWGQHHGHHRLPPGPAPDGHRAARVMKKGERRRGPPGPAGHRSWTASARPRRQ